MPTEEHYKKLALLAPRQKEVLKLLCQGKKYKEIAKKLFITTSTVKAHMVKVYEKLGLIELERDDRIFQIKSIYCPILQEKEKPETFVVSNEEIVDESKPEEIVENLEFKEKDEKSESEEIDDKSESEDIAGESESEEIDDKSEPEEISDESVPEENIDKSEPKDIDEESESEEKDDEPEPEDIDDESEPEELTPEMDEMLSKDEKAIIKYKGETIYLPSKPKEEKVKKSGIRRFFRTALVLIILVIFAVGGLYIWQNFFGGPEVIPSEIIQKEYYEVGEWVKQGDIWARIKEYDIDSIGVMDVKIEIWNKTPNELLFSYDPGISFSMTDNTGHIYELSGPFDISAMDNQIIDSQDVENIRYKATAATVAYYDQAIFSSDVTELYLTMDEFSVFNGVKFIIPIR